MDKEAHDDVYLVTGGTGSFGRAFTRYILSNNLAAKVLIFSRDEMKQWSMQSEFGNDPRLRFFIGDVRDRDRLYRAVEGVDFIVHAAATKIVPTAEYNPFEAVKTNVSGAMNVIDAALDKGVKKVVALSTDKASSPINLYGATKLTSDKLFVAANAYSGKRSTRFSVVRYGNVMGSRGSLIPFVLGLPEGEPSPITDLDMTRFMITLEEGIELVMLAFREMNGGEIFVRKIPSMLVRDILTALRPREDLKVVGIRPGEKIHEQMIGIEDAPSTFDFGNHYRILPSIFDWFNGHVDSDNAKPVPLEFRYSSDSNFEWMSQSHLQQWVKANQHNFLKI